MRRVSFCVICSAWEGTRNGGRVEEDCGERVMARLSVVKEKDNAEARRALRGTERFWQDAREDEVSELADMGRSGAAPVHGCGKTRGRLGLTAWQAGAQRAAPLHEQGVPI